MGSILLLNATSFLDGFHLSDGFDEVSNGYTWVLQHVYHHRFVFITESIIESLLGRPLQLHLVESLRISVLYCYLQADELLIVVLGGLPIELLNIAHLRLEVHIGC